MATYDEISESVETARSAGCKDLALLHCISGYPTPVEQSNLLQINELAKKFNVISGLSDHTIGTTAAIAAVALGASIIEKHFILSRDDGGPDSAFSIEPEEFSYLCRETRVAWQALGQIGYERQQVELGSRVFRRSIYFVRDLPKGSVISHCDIRRIRPGMGLAPKYYYEIIGKKLNAPVERGDPAKWDLFCE
jgi:N-acetylneuraminate synthase